LLVIRKEDPTPHVSAASEAVDEQFVRITIRELVDPDRESDDSPILDLHHPTSMFPLSGAIVEDGETHPPLDPQPSHLSFQSDQERLRILISLDRYDPCREARSRFQRADLRYAQADLMLANVEELPGERE